MRPGFLDLNDRTWYDKPRKYWCTRDGSRFYCGVPDWGDPEVMERLLGLAAETLDYGVDGFYLSKRSHSWWVCWPSPGWDAHLEPFGFNDSVVRAYKTRHGIDIRYEDYDAEAWHRVKGEIFTSFLGRVGAAVRRYEVPFILGTEPDRYTQMVNFESRDPPRPGGRYLHLYKDWEAWADAGIVDGDLTPLQLVSLIPDEDSYAASIPLSKNSCLRTAPSSEWLASKSWSTRDSVAARPRLGPRKPIRWNT